MNYNLLKLVIAMVAIGIPGTFNPSFALPSPDETSEEVLRTEIILEARSPLDGKPLTIAEYTELEEQLKERAFAPEIDPEVQQLIFQLRLLKLVRTFVPFF